jgi:hypothetical protein
MRRIHAHAGSGRSMTGLKSVLAISAYILLLSGCAMLQGDREIRGAGFEFALLGDVPYDARQEKEFAHVRKEIDAADLAFVVHNGDFWWDGRGRKKPEVFLHAATKRSRIVCVWRKAPNIPSYLYHATTTGPIAIVRSRVHTTRSKDSQNSARPFSKAIKASVGAPCG